jgi:hypothetical protein
MLLSCYNMFPSMFSDTEHMISYLKEVKKMGFNCVWINPLQIPNNQTIFKGRYEKLTGMPLAQVGHSIYSIRSSDEFDPILSITPEFLKEFTDHAKLLEIAPIFDLVLNHISPDNPLLDDQDKVTWFDYTKKDFTDTVSFNYDLKEVSKEIIEHYWKPYIEKYMQTYGFSGVRVDCARKIPLHVREAIYQIVKHINPPAIILEEVLFDDRAVEDCVNQMGNNSGATHVTGSGFFFKLEWHGGFYGSSTRDLNGDLNHEEHFKRQLVVPDGGLVHFTGNHDHVPFVNTIFDDIFTLDKIKHYPMGWILSSDNWKKKPFDIDWIKHQESKKEIENRIMLVLRYPYLVSYINEICDKDAHKQDFYNRSAHKLFALIFAGSGGYYMLSGDEDGNYIVPSVFTVFSKRSHLNLHCLNFNYKFENLDYSSLHGLIFSNIKSQLRDYRTLLPVDETDYVNFIEAVILNAKEAIKSVFAEMSKEMIKQILDKATFKELNIEDDLSYAYIDQVIKKSYFDDQYKTAIINKSKDKFDNILNSREEEVFKKMVTKKTTKSIIETIFKYALDNLVEHHKNRLSSDFSENMRKWISEANKLMNSLPLSSPNFFSEVFAYPKLESGEESVFVAVRFNGPGFENGANIVIINYLGGCFDLDQKFLKDIAGYIAKRCGVNAQTNAIYDSIYDDKLTKIFVGSNINVTNISKEKIVINLSVEIVSDSDLQPTIEVPEIDDISDSEQENITTAYISEIQYDNLLLNDPWGTILLNDSINLYGNSTINLLLETGKDRYRAKALIDSAKEKGSKETLKIFFGSQDNKENNITLIKLEVAKKLEEQRTHEEAIKYLQLLEKYEEDKPITSYLLIDYPMAFEKLSGWLQNLQKTLGYDIDGQESHTLQQTFLSILYEMIEDSSKLPIGYPHRSKPDFDPDDFGYGFSSNNELPLAPSDFFISNSTNGTGEII